MLLLRLLDGCRLSQGASSEGLQGGVAGNASHACTMDKQPRGRHRWHGLSADMNACLNTNAAASGTGWLTSIICMSSGCEAASCGEGCRQRSSLFKLLLSNSA